MLSFPDENYRSVAPFKNGLEKVEKIDKKDRNYGFVNTKGKPVIPYIYDYALDFLGDYAYVAFNKKSRSKSWVGFINKKSERVLELSDNKSQIWFDKEAKKILPKTYDKNIYDFYGNKVVLDY